MGIHTWYKAVAIVTLAITRATMLGNLLIVMFRRFTVMEILILFNQHIQFCIFLSRIIQLGIHGMSTKRIYQEIVIVVDVLTIRAVKRQENVRIEEEDPDRERKNNESLVPLHLKSYRQSIVCFPSEHGNHKEYMKSNKSELTYQREDSIKIQKLLNRNRLFKMDGFIMA
ncbi:Hypothetical predicted protein [Olea europaea subsp. europaea]|uniref:Uncharacterized protein n=1 Tax=Olea europaea subsp. europaea TaxID=158383 RepID=A0A8S0T0I6_OLEEU|nr:Hypothetical predicted protein [Olea europaea subsp. europaea]